MTLTIKQAPTPAQQTKKPRQGRSPAFPFIPLQKALERAETFRVAEGGRPKHFSPLTSAFAAWKLGAKTGPALQTVAAMGHYGLFEFQGSGESRAARLTDTALQILLDKQPVSPERDTLIAQVALKPAIHAELWAKWAEYLPSDPTLETYLVRDRGFSESGARDLIAEYKATIEFAKLNEAAIIPAIIDAVEGGNKRPPSKVEIGDFVQWSSGGVDQFATPRRVIGFSDDQQWLWVEGSETGIAVTEVQTVSPSSGHSVPATGRTPPTPPAEVLATWEAAKKIAGVTDEEKFVADEGTVIVQFPQMLSSASVEDLEAFFALFIKKARRRAEAREKLLSEGGKVLYPHLAKEAGSGAE